MSELTGPVGMTLDELAGFLRRPRVTGEQMRRIFAQLPNPDLDPIGTRPSGGGRPIDVYDADRVMEWHRDNRRWLTPRKLPGPDEGLAPATAGGLADQTFRR